MARPGPIIVVAGAACISGLLLFVALRKPAGAEPEANFYMPPKLVVVESGPEAGFYNVTFMSAITNKGNATDRVSLTWGSNYFEPGYHEEHARSIELAPGEVYDWAFTYTEVFDYYRGYFTCWLFGGWEGNNQAVGIWK